MLWARVRNEKASAQREGLRAGYPPDVSGSFARTSQVKNFGQASKPCQKNSIRADFLEGDATKHFSVKKRGFSVKWGEAIQ